VNAKKFKIILAGLATVIFTGSAMAQNAVKINSQANQLYMQGKFDKAVEQYDKALLDSPAACEPKFNKANSYYKLDDLQKASELFGQVAAQSKDMKLVSMAKYNLGNCAFKQGTKQKDSNPQKAIEQMESAISNWRGVLDIDKQNEKAAKNIEVARLTIKDLIDQMKNKKDPNQPQDPNQNQQKKQQHQQNQQQQQQQNQQASQDPNKVQDPNQGQKQQGQDPNDSQKQQAGKKDPNEPRKDKGDKQQAKPKEQKQQQENKQQTQEKKDQKEQDATAQEILDKEQKDKQQRQNVQRAGYKKVEKDW
jgi:Ca-activated chloride channel homolog